MTVATRYRDAGRVYRETCEQARLVRAAARKEARALEDWQARRAALRAAGMAWTVAVEEAWRVCREAMEVEG